MALFVTFVLLTNTVGVKLFTLAGITLPVSIIWYPLTFLVTDIVSEIYGARRARMLVIMGFAMSLVLLAFSSIGIALPVASVYPLQQDYENIFGPVWRLLFASMSAYLLAQMVDVQLFHFWKRLTRGRHLWLRNNGSTMISQLVDTTAVILITHYYAHALPIDPDLSVGRQLALFIFTGYAFKFLVAAFDTIPFYIGVHYLRRYLQIDPLKEHDLHDNAPPE